MTRSIDFSAATWPEFRDKMSGLAVEHGEDPATVLAALDRGGALPNLLAKLAGVDRPRKRPGPKINPARDAWLLQLVAEADRLGLRGSERADYLHRESDTREGIGSIYRNVAPSSTVRQAHRAQQRKSDKIA